MPSSKSPNSPSARKRHARRAPTTPHLPALRRVQQPQKQTEYISGMKKGDRVYHVLKDLRDKHRWSLKDFILHLVTEESTIKGSHTCAMHTKNLSSAIYQQEAVAKQLSKVSGRGLNSTILYDHTSAISWYYIVISGDGCTSVISWISWYFVRAHSRARLVKTEAIPTIAKIPYA